MPVIEFTRLSDGQVVFKRHGQRLDKGIDALLHRELAQRAVKSGVRKMIFDHDDLRMSAKVGCNRGGVERMNTIEHQNGYVVARRLDLQTFTGERTV